MPEHKQDPNRAEIKLIVDETTALCSALGNIPNQYPQLLRYGRSFGLQVITAVQSISGLLSLMDKDTCDDMLSNMPYKVFLDSSTPATSQLIIDHAGKFTSKHVSWSGTGKNRQQNTSFSEEDILRASEIVSIGGTDELILISSIGGYNRIKKCPYYEDVFFKDK